VKKVIIGFLVFASTSFIFSIAKDIRNETNMGVNFQVPSEEWRPGDLVYLNVQINNPTQETFRDIPLFVAWWVGFNTDPANWMYLPPPKNGEWLPGDVSYYTIDVPPGITTMQIMPTNEWPYTPGFSDTEGAGKIPIKFVAGMSNSLFTMQFGTEDWLAVYIY
jgi:hypothetical protein